MSADGAGGAVTLSILAAAFSANIDRSSDKFLLVALAIHADPTGISAPSQVRLIADTALDRKTVIAGLARLTAQGFVEDSGAKVGKTGRIPAYQLRLDARSLPQMVPISPPLNRPKNGIIKPAQKRDHSSRARSSTNPSLLSSLPSLSATSLPASDVQPLLFDSTLDAMRANKRGRKPTGVPPDWRPDTAGIEYAKQRRVPPAEVERFRDYWLSNGTPNAMKRDWNAAWRTWCRNHETFQNRNPVATSKPAAVSV